MERFTRFIDWPQNSPVNDGQTPFVIGVVGADPFGPYLKELAANRKIKGKRIVIRSLTADVPVESCHMLFIASSERKQLARILDRIGTRPVLTVSDSPGFGDAGVIVNFFRAGDRIRFEVNANAAEQSGLRVGSKLLKLARVIEEGER